jgi:hypothetical protein
MMHRPNKRVDIPTFIAAVTLPEALCESERPCGIAAAKATISTVATANAPTEIPQN